MKSLVSIQYLRALAALSVVAFHTKHTTILGQAGVDVFFVISGFIMWMVTAKPVGSLEFLRHRVIRIVPLYWIATLIMAAHQRASLADTVRSLLFVPYYNPEGELWPVLVQGWTLNLEMFFYLLFAMALLLPRRLQLMFLTVMLVGLTLVGLVFHPRGPLPETYTNQLLIEFMAGLWLSEAWLRGKLPGAWIGAGMMVLSIALYGLSLLSPMVEAWRFIIWGIPSLLLVAGAISVETAKGVPTLRIGKTIGDASYSVYLFHPFVLRTVAEGLRRFPISVLVSGVLLAGTAMGLAASYALERPLTAWLRKLTRGAAVPAVDLTDRRP